MSPLNVQSFFLRSLLSEGALILASCALVGTLIRLVYVTNRRLPGPFVAKFTNLYRVGIVLDGHMCMRFRRLHEKYGRIVQTGPRHVVVQSQEGIDKIYGDLSSCQKSEMYDIFRPTWDGISLDTILTTRSDEWHRTLVKALAPQINVRAIKSFECAVDSVTADLVQKLSSCQGNELSVDEWAKYWAWDISTIVNLGRSIGLLGLGKDAKGLINGLKTGFRYGAIIGQVPFLHPFLCGNERLLSLLRRYTTFVDPTTEVLEMATAAVDHKLDITLSHSICSLLERIHDSDGFIQSNLRRIDKINILFNNIISGAATTPTALTSTLCLLRDHPDVQERLFQEIKEHQMKGLISDDVINSEALNLPYLQAVINEALRLIPINAVPLERVVPEQGLVIEGTFLEPGTRVGISAAAMHHIPEIYGHDHELFRPERWIESSEQQRALMKRAFFAWGRGKRGCIGKAFAMMQLNKGIIQILRQFELHAAQDGQKLEATAWWLPEYSNTGTVFRRREKAV